MRRGRSDRQAVVTLRRPFAEWQGLFTPLLPKEATASPEVFNTGWLESPAITAGPFAVERIDRTGKTITLRRNPSWWAHKPPLDRILLRVLDPATRADELANHGVDVYPIGADLDLYTRAAAMPGVEIRSTGLNWTLRAGLRARLVDIRHPGAARRGAGRVGADARNIRLIGLTRAPAPSRPRSALAESMGVQGPVIDGAQPQ